MKITIRMIALPQISSLYLAKIQNTVEIQELGDIIHIENAAYWKEPRYIETKLIIENDSMFEEESAYKLIESVFDEKDYSEFNNLPVSYDIDHCESLNRIDQGKPFWCMSFEN